MNRRLQWVNLFGVFALAFLCVAQWQRDRRLNLDLNRSEKARLDQAAKLDEQAGAFKSANEDLAQLKTSLAEERSLRSQAEQKSKSEAIMKRQLALERNELKSAITNWSDAVTLRDERLKEANARIEQLAADLNASIRKFNELVTNYNSVVSELNSLRTTNAAMPPAAAIRKE